MLSFQLIALQNFKSYSGSHTFRFPKEPGLYFLTGDNQFEPKLESNGSGKSTLLDAIYWCLFGRTLRGLKSGDIVTWGQSSASVTLALTVGDLTFQLRRKQSPNSLEIEDGNRHPLDEEVWRPVTQDELQKHIRLNPESFAYSVMLSQFGQSFFELAPNAKLALFSEIMNLELWLDRSKLAEKKIKELEIELAAVEQALLDIEALTKGTEEAIKLFTQKEKTAEDETKQRLVALGGRITAAISEIEWLGPKEVLVKSNLEADIQHHKDWLDQKKRVEAKNSQYNEQREEIAKSHAEVTVRLEVAERSYAQLMQLKSKCPTCLQSVDKTHLVSERKKAVKEVEDLISRQLKLKHDFDATRAFCDKTLQSIAEANSVLAEAEISMDTRRERLRTLQAKVRELEIAKSGLEAEERAVRKSKNVYADIVKDENRKLGLYKKIMDERSKRKNILDAEAHAVSYWTGGFKKVRLFIIEEALKELELETNNSLAQLGLTDWQIEFDVERENKSGGITKGFVVFIKSPAHPEPVKWESWSGGETQRLQLAGTFGLSNLIMTQAGLSNKIEFYDEPSKYLAEGGILDLVETLHQRAMDEGKVIFLIDHHAIEFGGFSSVYKVVKTKNGSSFNSC